MAITNQERIGKAMELLRAGLARLAGGPAAEQVALFRKADA